MISLVFIYLAIWYARKKLLIQPKSKETGIASSLDEYRKLLDEGKISAQEYERIRKLTLGLLSGPEKSPPANEQPTAAAEGSCPAEDQQAGKVDTGPAESDEKNKAT